MQAVSVPELPDIAAYLSALETRIIGPPLERIRLANAFLLRTVQPPIKAVEGHTILSLRRVGKRIAIEFDNGVWDGPSPDDRWTPALAACWGETRRTQ
jgi:formamidopyrimidine-DNA glycosylase